MHTVVIDTTSKEPDSIEKFTEGIKLAHKHQSRRNPSGWLNKQDKKNPLELILVGKENEIDAIARRIPKIPLQTIPATNTTTYKEPPFKIFKRYVRQQVPELLSQLESAHPDFSSVDSCLVADALGEKMGAAIHFFDTGQAGASVRALFGIDDTGLLASTIRYEHGKLATKPLLIADAGMQLAKTESRLYTSMLANAWYTIATAKTIGLEPRIVFGALSRDKEYTYPEYVRAHDFLKEIAEDIKIKLLGYEKDYDIINKEHAQDGPTIFLTHGRHGNVLPQLVGKGAKGSKDILKRRAKRSPLHILAYTPLGAVGFAYRAFLSRELRLEELENRTFSGHIGRSNSYKANSGLTPLSIAGAILGAHEFTHVKGTYHNNIAQLSPFFEGEIERPSK